MTDTDFDLEVIKYLLIIVAIVVIGVLVSCGSNPIKTENSLKYQVIEIDDMTCIRWSSMDRGGLTCNWNEWKDEIR